MSFTPPVGPPLLYAMAGKPLPPPPPAAPTKAEPEVVAFAREFYRPYIQVPEQQKSAFADAYYRDSRALEPELAPEKEGIVPAPDEAPATWAPDVEEVVQESGSPSGRSKGLKASQWSFESLSGVGVIAFLLPNFVPRRLTRLFVKSGANALKKGM